MTKPTNITLQSLNPPHCKNNASSPVPQITDPQEQLKKLVAQRYDRIRQIIENSLSSPHDTGTQRINYSDDDLAFGKAVHIHEWSYHGPLPTSPFYHEFETLIAWGRSKGLNIQFEYQQDEFQVDRWYDIHVYPL